MQPPSTVPRVIARRILLLTTTCLLNLKRSFASKEINKQKNQHKHINSTIQYNTIRPPRYTLIKTAQPTATKWIEQANPSINNDAQISEKFILTVTCLLKLQTMNHFKRSPQKSISATTLTAQTCANQDRPSCGQQINPTQRNTHWRPHVC